MYPLFFMKFLFFTKWQPVKNYEKYFLCHLKSSLRSGDIQIFVFSSSPLFFPANHCFRGWSKKNLKMYDVINCLNKNLTHFVLYLEKEIRFDNETLPIGREFLWKNHAENMHQKLAPDSFLILLNDPKQPFHVRNSFKI